MQSWSFASDMYNYVLDSFVRLFTGRPSSGVKRVAFVVPYELCCLIKLVILI
jgi:hypothetical protein